jgi:hypothetical protein
MKIQIGPHTSDAGQRRRALGFDIWSEDGVVFLESKKHGEVSVLTQKEATERMKAFGEECDVWDKMRDHGSADEKAYAREMHASLKTLVSALSDTIIDAHNQGDPNNEDVRRQKLHKFLREKCAGRGTRAASDNPFQAANKPFKLYTGDYKPYGS